MYLYLYLYIHTVRSMYCTSGVTTNVYRVSINYIGVTNYVIGRKKGLLCYMIVMYIEQAE